MRGNRDAENGHRRDFGSIPACAGEPALRGTFDRRSRVYPRVCGGTVRLPFFVPVLEGLSPRVRGNHLVTVVVNHLTGSIPACAGEPKSLHATLNRSWVYPRVCGGTFGSSMPLSLGTGLSPRVRGNHRGPHRRLVPGGSIPACAGEPFIQRMARSKETVYPRVCGGTHRSSPFPRHVLGLSPRVRGNRHRSDRLGRRSGSIPACAGEPPGCSRRQCSMRVYPRVCGGTSSN